MEPVPVTVVIAARNEGRQIADCVRSVAWAREVLVVENDSTDDTVARAQAAGATVFSHPFVSIGAQRNAAIDRASQDWVLVVDADERGSSALRDEVACCLTSQNQASAYRIPRRNVFLGREIRHGGWDGSHDRPVRLFRRGMRYDERPVHEHVITADAPGTLHSPLAHEPYASLDEYFAKLARYSRDWARQQFDRGRRAGIWPMIVRPPARFVTMFFFRGGWRDGAHGALLAVLAAMSVAAKYAQLWALSRGAPHESR